MTDNKKQLQDSISELATTVKSVSDTSGNINIEAIPGIIKGLTVKGESMSNLVYYRHANYRGTDWFTITFPQPFSDNQFTGLLIGDACQNAWFYKNGSSSMLINQKYDPNWSTFVIKSFSVSTTSISIGFEGKRDNTGASYINFFGLFMS